jgi:hypothetical protein
VEVVRNTKFWAEILKGRDYFGDTGLDRNIILKCMCSKWDINMWKGVL